MSACSQPGSKAGNIGNDASVARGGKLASVWCGGCHQVPDPSLLNKSMWRDKVLPYMGLRLGFHSPVADSFIVDDNIADASIYPTHKLIGDEDWNDIIRYYVLGAPDTMLPQPMHELPRENPALFEPIFVNITHERPAVCFVKVDTLQKPHQLVFADAFKRIFRLDNDYKVLDYLQVPGPVVDMNWTGTHKIYTNIGSIDPLTQKLGSVGRFRVNKEGQPVFNILFDSLSRPVQVFACDLNADNETDYIICEFGVGKGTLSWMENKKAGKYQKHILIDQPGAVKAIVADVNKDGLPDIYALMAQGDESIWLLTNEGNGRFDAQKILQFPPLYGSVSFELIDFNKDGYLDILYACGDNADVTPVLKSYHGIYIFTNDKTNHFMQSYFYPMHGCYKAMAADFNGDGNIDIAAISFFADYAKRPEGFVYLSDQGNNRFEPYSIAETTEGRWLCMDIGDINGDQKPDIVLGNMAAPLYGDENMNRWIQSASLLVLKNIMK
ncbi:MAG: VCBS repeat-containing protein [Chitinophagaceae bacterium]|nr:VCBS repeat-containing protein [Chitinophagaceae bacterium]